MLARLGRDEFGILLERANEPSDAMRLANQVQIELNTPLTRSELFDTPCPPARSTG